MKSSFKNTPALLLLAAAMALPMAAQAQDSKRALATKLAQIQKKSDAEQITNQLIASVAQPVIGIWSQRIDQSVPQARQKDVRDKLDAELKKLVDNTRKTVGAQVDKTAESSLVPVYMEKFSEDELKTIVTYLETPAATKFQTVGGEATGAWVKKIIDSTKGTVEGHVKTFDTAAARIVGGTPAPAKK